MGQKVGLSESAVLDAAAALADAEGLEAASLAAVAERLGIRTPSLYHYVDGAAGLRRALAMRGAALLAAELRPSARLRGEPAVRALMAAFLDFARRHPGLYAAFLPAPRPGEDDPLYRALAEPVQVVAEVLTAWGVPGARVIPAIRALRSLLHGWIVLERDGGFGMPVDLDASRAFACDLFVDGLAQSVERRAHRRSRSRKG